MPIVILLPFKRTIKDFADSLDHAFSNSLHLNKFILSGVYDPFDASKVSQKSRGYRRPNKGQTLKDEKLSGFQFFRTIASTKGKAPRIFSLLPAEHDQRLRCFLD